MQSYNINPNTRGVNGFGLLAPDFTVSVLFDAATEATVTVPGDIPAGQIGMIGSSNPIGNVGQNPIGHNKYIAVFRYGTKTPGNIVVSLNATAVQPTVNAFTQLAATLMPPAWNVKTGDVIHAISDTTDSLMSIDFYHIVE